MNYSFIDKYIGEKLKDKRIEKRYTLVEMAELIGVSRQGYYDYENGKTTIPSERCAKICNYLGISFLDLMQDALDNAKNKLMKESVEVVLQNYDDNK